MILDVDGFKMDVVTLLIELDQMLMIEAIMVMANKSEVRASQEDKESLIETLDRMKISIESIAKSSQSIESKSDQRPTFSVVVDDDEEWDD